MKTKVCPKCKLKYPKIKRKCPDCGFIKPRSVGDLKKDLWNVFSIYIRTRDCLRTTGCASWGLCISCDRRYHFKLLQAGHFLPGRHGANLYYERGVHAQCYNCNLNLKGNTLPYMDALVKLYGEGVIEELRYNNSITKQYKEYEIKEMIAVYKQKIKELEVK